MWGASHAVHSEAKTGVDAFWAWKNPLRIFDTIFTHKIASSCTSLFAHSLHAYLWGEYTLIKRHKWCSPMDNAQYTLIKFYSISVIRVPLTKSWISLMAFPWAYWEFFVPSFASRRSVTDLLNNEPRTQHNIPGSQPLFSSLSGILGVIVFLLINSCRPVSYTHLTLPTKRIV